MGFCIDYFFKKLNKVKVRLSRGTRVKRANTTGAYPGFCSTNQLRELLLSPGWDASPSQGYPSSMSPVPILYTWVERENVGSLRKQHAGRV